MYQRCISRQSAGSKCVLWCVDAGISWAVAVWIRRRWLWPSICVNAPITEITAREATAMVRPCSVTRCWCLCHMPSAHGKISTSSSWKDWRKSYQSCIFVISLNIGVVSFLICCTFLCVFVIKGKHIQWPLWHYFNNKSKILIWL